MNTGGFNFGTTSATQSGTGLGGGGFNFAATTSASTGGFALAAPISSTTGTGLAMPTLGSAGTGGFNFGGGLGANTTSTQSGGLTLGGLSTATPVGLGGLGITPTTASTGLGLGLGGAKPALNFGGTATTVTTTTASGFGLGGTTTTTSTGLGMGGLGAATTKPTLALGAIPASSTGLTLGAPGALGLGAAKPAGTGFTFAGTGLGTVPQSTAAYGATVVSAAGTKRGLGGPDPQTTTSGVPGASGKLRDTKAVKESMLPNEIMDTVTNFKTHVKAQKTVREDITRMTPKPLLKVQEEVAALKKLLSLVSNGLQRNAGSIDKLKLESAQEIRNVEIAQRTKDTPPGLQYENTAPDMYFANLVEDFEQRMLMYRQQIEEMETHLAALHQPPMLSPQELSLLLTKIHESFVALASQLHAVHEAVQTQKDHYLNYRKVFLGDNTDIFERRRKAASVQNTGVNNQHMPPTTLGPTPFTGMSNAAATAMANAMNRTQQPPGPSSSLTGLGSNPLGTIPNQSLFKPSVSGFGAAPTTTASSTGFGGFGFSGFGSSTSTNTATVKPLGFGTPNQGGLLGSSTTSAAPSGFLSAPTQGPTVGVAQPLGFGTPQAQTGFQLQKPPQGSKRGKKA